MKKNDTPQNKLKTQLSIFCSKHDIDSDSEQKNIAVALSGGADSMASLIAINEHFPSWDITAIIVNHKLRAEIEKEINLVTNWLQKLKIKFVILDWQHEGINNNLQEQARDFRYQAITNYCIENNINYLFTGHNLDDQIETFLIRLNRGSGLDGLSSMQEISTKNNIQICRPFLNLRKKDFINYLIELNHPWIEDPSNQNEKFLRIKIRKLFESEEFFYKRMELVISNLQRSKSFIEEETKKAELNTLQYCNWFIKLNIESYKNLHEEIRLRILNLALNHFHASNKKRRLASIIRVDNFITDPKSRTYNIESLILNKVKNEIFIQQEIAQKRQEIKSTGEYDYQGYKFLIKELEPVSKGWYFGKLEQSHIAILKKSMTKLEFNSRIISNIPGVFALEKLICIPHIRYYSDAKYSNYIEAE
jgi:tRNA(Ile)-lysidine synthase